MKFLCYVIVAGLLTFVLGSVGVFVFDWQWWAMMGIIALYQLLAIM